MHIQKKSKYELCVLIGLSFSLIACGSSELKKGYSISNSNIGNTPTIRFLLGGGEELPQLPADAPEIKQDVSAQIAARAHIYAKKKDQELHLCSNGFVWPGFVSGEPKGFGMHFEIVCN
jgi:hypothetical protein